MNIKSIPAAILLVVATSAWADEARIGGGGFSLFVSFMQMAFALLVVLGLILLVYYGATRLVKTIPAFQQSGKHIRIVEVRPMGPRKALVLVEVGGEYLLLSNCDANLSLIKQISMLEEIEVVDDTQPKASFLSFLNRAKAPEKLQ